MRAPFRPSCLPSRALHACQASSWSTLQVCTVANRPRVNGHGSNSSQENSVAASLQTRQSGWAAPCSCVQQRQGRLVSGLGEKRVKSEPSSDLWSWCLAMPHRYEASCIRAQHMCCVCCTADILLLHSWWVVGGECNIAKRGCQESQYVYIVYACIGTDTAFAKCRISHFTPVSHQPPCGRQACTIRIASTTLHHPAWSATHALHVGWCLCFKTCVS